MRPCPIRLDALRRNQATFFKQPDCREGVDSVKGKRPARFGPIERPATT
jgi:hypothetical protein